MSLVDMSSLGWEIAGAMGLYTIARNYFQDSKQVKEKKETAFANAVTAIADCRVRLDRNDRELSLLADIVKKHADLSVLVAGLSGNVRALEAGLADVKASARDLNNNITEFFRQQRLHN